MKKTFGLSFLALILFVSCTTGNTVVYKLTGTATVAELNYSISGNDQIIVSSSSIPWQESVSISSSAFSPTMLYLHAVNKGTSGDITAEIWVDGRLSQKKTSVWPETTVMVLDGVGGI